VHWIRSKAPLTGRCSSLPFLACCNLGIVPAETQLQRDGAALGQARNSADNLQVASVALYRISPVVMASKRHRSRFGAVEQKRGYRLRCVVLSRILALDLVRYSTHRLSHSVVLFGDSSSASFRPGFRHFPALRVHPIEVVLTQGAYLLTVAVSRTGGSGIDRRAGQYSAELLLARERVTSRWVRTTPGRVRDTGHASDPSF